MAEYKPIKYDARGFISSDFTFTTGIVIGFLACTPVFFAPYPPGAMTEYFAMVGVYPSYNDTSGQLVTPHTTTLPINNFTFSQWALIMTIWPMIMYAAAAAYYGMEMCRTGRTAEDATDIPVTSSLKARDVARFMSRVVVWPIAFSITGYMLGDKNMSTFVANVLIGLSLSVLFMYGDYYCDEHLSANKNGYTIQLHGLTKFLFATFFILLPSYLVAIVYQEFFTPFELMYSRGGQGPPDYIYAILVTVAVDVMLSLAFYLMKFLMVFFMYEGGNCCGRCNSGPDDEKKWMTVSSFALVLDYLTNITLTAVVFVIVSRLSVVLDGFTAI